MKGSIFRLLNFFSILLLLIAVIQYYLLTPLNFPHEKFFTTNIAFDNNLKLIPGFIIPYISVYVLIILSVILISMRKEAQDLMNFLLSIILLWSIINFLHGFLHTQNTLRPQLGEAGLFFSFVN